MFELFYMGGPLFMGILTLLLLGIIILSVRAFMGSGESKEGRRHKGGRLIKSIGLLSMVIGMLGILIGMYSAMAAIEASGGVSGGVLAGGLKIALIAPTYGLMIYGLSILISIALKR